MGYEEKITFDVENPNEIDHLLRSHRYFKRYDPERKLYSFYKTESWQGHEWPDADVAIELDGIYFCDCLGTNVEDLRADIAEIARRYAPNCEFEEL